MNSPPCVILSHSEALTVKKKSKGLYTYTNNKQKGKGLNCSLNSKRYTLILLLTSRKKE